MVDDIQGGACVVIWWKGGDETTSVDKIGFVVWDDWWGGLCP